MKVFKHVTKDGNRKLHINQSEACTNLNEPIRDIQHAELTNLDICWMLNQLIRDMQDTKLTNQRHAVC